MDIVEELNLWADSRDKGLFVSNRIERRAAIKITRLRAENEILKAALAAVARRSPVMGSRGDYRQGQLDALAACSEVAKAALAAKEDV